MIKKAVIPIAGKGTRFLPITTVLPKAMFPIIDKPVIYYLLEELITVNIKDIIIVINEEMNMVKQFFDTNSQNFKDLSNRYKEVEMLEGIINNVNIKYVVQDRPLGLGHAIFCAKEEIGNDDFVVILGDDLIDSDGKETYGIGSLLSDYNKSNGYYLGVQKVADSDVGKYGIIKSDDYTNTCFKINTIIEKPKGNAPSNYACLGRYILRNSIFKYIEKVKTDTTGEIQLTDALALALEEGVYATVFNGKRYDIGSKEGYVKATIDFALKRSDLSEETMKHLKME